MQNGITAGEMPLSHVPASELSGRGANTEAYIMTSKLLKATPEATHVYPVHLAACFELDKKSELYLKGQELSKLVPDSALSQYAFGVY